MPCLEDENLPRTLLELKYLMARKANGLTKRTEKVARFTFANPGDMAFYSETRLARACGVSTSTVYRFVSFLGFKSYETFRELFRKELREIARRPSALREPPAARPAAPSVRLAPNGARPAGQSDTSGSSM
ncbi:MurR/RpiR family transcriptional regulator [Pleomorphomonas carboxyditropha]|uniref:HTH rpiR-type domain-containing protein n=1 Tax=Pleomorphomonas carboxyditropha TaxID=2023338 RepID=A0A2G9WN50_9HYPH|nr:MurR/RpiR family transcriptional regulator [Pleomorphomonas carboxyditropha]PIO96138.1 hypothetical protein CJ014_26980 [Pleomorphomonas carboxyditropha]